jgi:hypothetical protein
VLFAIAGTIVSRLQSFPLLLRYRSDSGRLISHGIRPERRDGPVHRQSRARGPRKGAPLHHRQGMDAVLVAAGGGARHMADHQIGNPRPAGCEARREATEPHRVRHRPRLFRRFDDPHLAMDRLWRLVAREELRPDEPAFLRLAAPAWHRHGRNLGHRCDLPDARLSAHPADRQALVAVVRRARSGRLRLRRALVAGADRAAVQPLHARAARAGARRGGRDGAARRNPSEQGLHVQRLATWPSRMRRSTRSGR